MDSNRGTTQVSHDRRDASAHHHGSRGTAMRALARPMTSAGEWLEGGGSW
jgi:hypothetical protein